MTISRKLLIAILVLTAGAGTAWLFRKRPHDEVAQADRADEAMSTGRLALRHPSADAPAFASEQRAVSAGTSSRDRFPSGNPPSQWAAAAGADANRPDHRAPPPPPPALVPRLPDGFPAEVDSDRSLRPIAPIVAPPSRLAPLDDEPDVMATTHHVADGDTLADLAKRYLRDPSRANEIYELNRALIPDPELLPIGVELRLPRRNPPAVDQPASADAIRDSAEIAVTIEQDPIREP